MKIDLVKVKLEPVNWSEEVELEKGDVSPDIVEISTVSWKGKVYYAYPFFVVEFDYSYSQVIRCARCLEDISTKEKGFARYLISWEVPYTEEENVRLKEKDLGVIVVTDRFFDLTSLLSDEIEMRVPVKVLCSESCKGICAKCGVNLNFESCDCEEEIDHRWIKLLNVVGGKDGST